MIRQWVLIDTSYISGLGCGWGIALFETREESDFVLEVQIELENIPEANFLIGGSPTDSSLTNITYVHYRTKETGNTTDYFPILDLKLKQKFI